MKFHESDVRLFTDMMMEGLIFIDPQGIIRLYNQKAKEIFGVVYHQPHEHPPGQLVAGDLVILADNRLGEDDGGLNPSTLALMGVAPGSVRQGDAVIAAGIMGGASGSAKVLVHSPEVQRQSLEMTASLKKHRLQAAIHYEQKKIRLQVDHHLFELPYQSAIGHLVALDGTTGALKFYQERGYSVRNEALRQLLEGSPFRGKGRDEAHLDVLGKHLTEIHEPSEVIREFLETAAGRPLGYSNRFAEINGRQTLCSLFPLDRDGCRQGAVLKVEDVTEMKKALQERDDALRNLEMAENRLKAQSAVVENFAALMGESPEIIHTRKLAMKAAASKSTVLLLGESGTGKNLLAKAIHHAGSDPDAPFVQVNCGSIPENLLESELFGYEKGAFTGARDEGKPGLFELAHGGTLLLDEIGELPVALQVKLLQVLQQKSFYRVGGSEKKEVQVRIMAATNRNLEEEMLRGRFREDLYYRINVFPIWMPPLRKRRGDIELLVRELLPRICREAGVAEKRVSAEGLQKLMDYHWPGNVRELENILERAVHLCEGPVLLSGQLMVTPRQGGVEAHRGTHGPDGTEDVAEIKNLKTALLEREAMLIREALARCNGRRRQAMQQLGIGKTQFYEKLKYHGIE